MRRSRKRLGVSVIELALGVQRVANATMVRALARVTVERGVDGRQCTLLAFGGAGPMHAAQLAREFGITEIVVPRFSSGFSALGCIVADMSYTQQQAVRMLSTHWDAERFGNLHDDMLETLIAPLRRQGHDGRPSPSSAPPWSAMSARALPWRCLSPHPLDLARLGSDFRDAISEIYGYATDEHWEMQSLRVRALVPRRRRSARWRTCRHAGADQHRSLLVRAAAPHETPRFDRDRCRAGARDRRAGGHRGCLVDHRRTARLRPAHRCDGPSLDQGGQA